MKFGRQKNQISYDITYMWNLKKNDTNELIYKTEIDSPDIENKLMVTKGERRWRGISSEFGINRHTLLYIK